jgi:hypothetical protein
MQKSRNEREKMELQQTILSTEKKENGEVYIAVEKSKLKKNNTLYKLLDFLTPNWKTFIQDAVGYAKEKKLVST